MAEIFFSIIFLTIIVLISGIILSNYIFKIDENTLEIYALGFIGIIIIAILSFFVHFFFPLNEIVNGTIFIIIGSIFLLSNKKNFIFFKLINLKIALGSLVIIFIMTLKSNPNEDYGYYHLPYIVNLISEKIIFGLSNLQVNFAWNSSWLNFSSMFYFPFLKLKGTQLSNSILFLFVIYFFLKEIFNSNNSQKLSKFYLIILSYYFIIKFSRISEHGFDLPANFFLLISFYYFIKLFEETNINLIKKNFIFIYLFVLFSFTIKISTFSGIVLIFSSTLYFLKQKTDIKCLGKPFLFFSLFGIFWLTQQFIYSGCLSPFFKFTCVETLSWYNEGLSDSVTGATGAVNKSYNNYLGPLSENEYLKNFNWVTTWFNRNKIELIEHLIAFLVPIAIFVFFNLKNNKIKSKNKNYKINEKKLFYFSSFLFIFLGLLVWFLKSPVIRFGVPYLFTLCFFLIFFIIKYFSLRIEKGIFLVLIISLFFNISKNLNRVKNAKNIEYWPEVLNVQFSSIEKGGFIINYPDTKNNFHKLKYCWSIPFICHMGKGNNLNFEKKNGYIFIEKD